MTSPTGTRIHDGTPSHDLTTWLTGTPHTWADGQLVLHSPDGDTHPQPGWWLIRWDDDTITTASPTVAERVYGPDGLWGRLQRAEHEITQHIEDEGADIAAGSYAGRVEELQAGHDRVRRLAARIRQGVPWASNFDNLADRIEGALDGEQPADVGTEFVQQADHPDEAALAKVEADLAPPRPWSTCTVTVDHGPHPWHDPWPLPHGQDAHCPGRPTPEPARSWLLAGTRDLDIPVDRNRPDSVKPQASSGGELDNPADNQTAPASLRARLAHTLRTTPNSLPDIGRLEFPDHHGPGEPGYLGWCALCTRDVDALTEALLTAVTEHLEIGEEQAWCKYCRRAWDSPRHRCESDAEQRVYGIAELRDQWIAAGPPPLGTSINRWWDRRFVELTNVLNGEPPGTA